MATSWWKAAAEPDAGDHFMTSRHFLHFIVLALFAAFAMAPASGQSNDKTERLGVPGPLAFDGQNYALAWTAHPSAEYFKQEYLPAGQGLDSYTHMLLIEALTSNVTPKDAAASQIAMLKERKAKDPLVNHEVRVHEQTGDVVLDFLVSGAANGKIIVEWNAYRYATLKGNKRGIVLHGISRRAYGEDAAKNFLTGLKDWRTKAISELVRFETPALEPKP
jgi:hypothetical protein